MNSVYMAEIICVNGIGISLMLFLLLTRIENIEEHSVGKRLFDAMIWLIIGGCLAETLTFALDGRIFFACRSLSYLLNSFCFIGTSSVGYMWCLYMDFRIFRSVKRIRKRWLFLGIPLLTVIIMNLVNLTGCGIVFRITQDNIYQRGSLVIFMYLFMFFYFFYGIYIAKRARENGLHMKFLPVLYFVIPSILGTVIQGMFYGITLGWATGAIALMFVFIETQSLNVYMDALSGLYNRRYMNTILNKIKNDEFQLYGIMIDVNGFKRINDIFGHTVGDNAIRWIGRILLDSIPENGIAIRYAGDEFLVLLHTGKEADVKAVLKGIEKNVDQFNHSGIEPYWLSFSMGYSKYENDTDGVEKFLSAMDKEMYEKKRQYYQSPAMGYGAENISSRR